MMSDLDKLRDDAIYLVDSLAMAASRTTTAKRALDDAIYEEKAAGQKLRDAIGALRKAVEKT